MTSEVDSPTRSQVPIRRRPRDCGSQVPGTFGRHRDSSEGRVGRSDPARDRSESSLTILYINRSVLCPISSTRYPSELASDLRLRLTASPATCELRLRTVTAYCELRLATCDLRLRLGRAFNSTLLRPLRFTELWPRTYCFSLLFSVRVIRLALAYTAHSRSRLRRSTCDSSRLSAIHPPSD